MKLKTKRSSLLGTFATLLVVQPVVAEENHHAVDDLDLVKLLNVEVSTATKTAESIDEAPAIITVVTKEEIATWGYQSVAEVLSHTMGFYLIDDHIVPNAAVRGMTGGLGAESGVIKVMIDGHATAYRTTSGNWLGVELVPLGSIQQIEIIRGPASALYGADAFLGVVNIITMKPQDLRPLRFRTSLGLTATNPSGRVDAVTGGVLGPFDYMLGFAGEQADRSGLVLPDESPAPTLPSDDGRRVARSLERRSGVLQGRIGYRDSEVGELVLHAYGSGIERGGDFAHWAQLTAGTDAAGNEKGTVVALQQLRISLDAIVHASTDLDLALQGTYFQGGVLPQDRIEIANELFYIERNQSYRGFDTTAEARWTPTRWFNGIVGLQTILDREHLRNPDRISRETEEPFDLDESPAPGADVKLLNLGAYLSANAKVWDPWLKLTSGIRYDNHSEYGGQLTGRVGATSRLTDEVIAKLLYGSAFKAPSPYLLYARPFRPGDVVGSEDLAPQLVHTVEYQMSYKPSRFLGFSSGVAHSWLLDKAEFTARGINQAARNVASQRSLSWESRADFEHYDAVRFYGSFERVWSERDLGREGYVADLVGTENVVYPSWIARSGLLVGVPSPTVFPLRLGGQGILVGPRRTADTSIVESGHDRRLPSYLMLDLSLTTGELYLAPGHESRFALRTRNLLATTGPDPGPSGFEYPLRPSEIFLEFSHMY